MAVDPYETSKERAITLQDRNFRFASGMLLEGPIEALHPRAESSYSVGLRLCELRDAAFGSRPEEGEPKKELVKG